jgi:hypothetical protein
VALTLSGEARDGAVNVELTVVSQCPNPRAWDSDPEPQGKKAIANILWTRPKRRHTGFVISIGSGRPAEAGLYRHIRHAP